MKKFLPLTIVMFLSVSLSGSCKNDSPGSVTPDISVNSTSVQVSEDAPDGLATISVILSAASNRKVTVEYSTADSTATAGKDYTAVTRGTLVFNTGEISKDIKISIIPDGDMKQDVYFKLTLSNPENGVIKSPKTTIKIINVDFATLVWSDEFNSATLNTSVWNYEQGASGWGNNELENYTNSTDNVHIDSGYLHITALNPSGSSYTSGRITTAGKREFTYGRADIRAELPEGKGIWPALWMLGSNFATAGWPKCGEIDIMELLGQYPSLVHGSVHWDANGHQSRTSDYTLPGAKFSSGFHIFSLIWTPNTLKWLVDNQQYCYLSRSEISGFPFDLPQFFIFNVAVGGNWPGSPDESTVFPQNMIVDYIRVYQ